MTTPMTNPGNATKTAQLQRMLKELLADALRRGFFGTAAIELHVADGTIQHIRAKMERIEK
jgi:hypothetical protein